jgi:antitoxin component YwqK of YwqJK toxin-antitoxin module
MKYTLLFIICVFTIAEAKCQNTDTLITYIKNITPAQPQIVSNLDSADYFRIIYPSGNADSIYNIKEFYKDGKIKFVGKFDLARSKNYHLNQFWLTGYCISYYPNGKKQDISNYVDGQKDGLEYLYRTNGILYCVKKNVNPGHPYRSHSLGWECYDENGSITCNEGNGRWIIYDPNFTRIILSGQLKNGMPEGEWDGITMRSDSIKYKYMFSKGECKSAVGYDKSGGAYSFTLPVVYAYYDNGSTIVGNLVRFVKILRSHLSLPKESNGKKMNVDTVHFTFVIEKNGEMSNIELCGKDNPPLKEAIIAAAKKCNNWVPSKYYGVPFRTQLTLSLTPDEGFQDNYYVRSIDAKGQLLDFSQGEPDFPHQGAN